ncbi:MAG: hypothetical protein M5T61_20845, partial [Acidimicrobiia bacterium]|nr:hypothetical protein [Acidimicrobiia bacterium]
EESDLAGALDEFDRVNANVSKLERIWKEIQEVTPSDVVFGLDSPESEDLVRSFAHIADQLPRLIAFGSARYRCRQDEIAQNRFDAERGW